MSPEAVRELLSLPVVGVLIWLLIREQSAKEKLLAELLLQARQHAEHLVEMACHGYFDKKDP